MTVDLPRDLLTRWSAFDIAELQQLLAAVVIADNSRLVAGDGSLYPHLRAELGAALLDRLTT